MIGSHPAFCDGGTYDLNWARMLARASRVPATFKIGDFDMITARCDQVGYMRLVRWLDRSAIPHRARGDAERLMKALAHGFGLKVGDSIDVPLPQVEA
jgi:hypothetical protein